MVYNVSIIDVWQQLPNSLNIFVKVTNFETSTHPFPVSINTLNAIKVSLKGKIFLHFLKQKKMSFVIFEGRKKKILYIFEIQNFTNPSSAQRIIAKGGRMSGR